MNKKAPQLRIVWDKDIQSLIIQINTTCDKLIATVSAIYPHAFAQQE